MPAAGQTIPSSDIIDLQTAVEVGSDPTIGTAATGFTTVVQQARSALNGALVMVCVVVVCTAGITASGGGIPDTLCFTLDAAWWPEDEINAVIGTGSITGEMVVNTDGTCVLRAASDSIPPAAAIRFNATFIREV